MGSLVVCQTFTLAANHYLVRKQLTAWQSFTGLIKKYFDGELVFSYLSK